MRTNLISAVVNGNVFGFGQDRVVSLRNDSCARAAQHLHAGYVGKRARKWAGALKRAWSALMAGPARMAEATCLAITGPARRTARIVSPVVVVT